MIEAQPSGDVELGDLAEVARPGTVRRLLRQRSTAVALAFVGALLLVAALAPWITPDDPNAQDLTNRYLGPSRAHWLGTDDLGRDQLSRVIVGARVSVLAAIEAVSFALVLGVVPGLLAGYLGGHVDRLVSVVNDALMTFPALLLAVAVVGSLGPNLHTAMIAGGIIFAPRFVRLSRATALSIRGETYIEASRLAGTRLPTMIRRHVLPNAAPPIVVQASLLVGYSMLLEASLSFLGLGVQPPDASWGSMMARALRNLNQQAFMMVPPGFALVVTLLAVNTVGDGLLASIGRRAERP